MAGPWLSGVGSNRWGSNFTECAYLFIRCLAFMKALEPGLVEFVSKAQRQRRHQSVSMEIIQSI